MSIHHIVEAGYINIEPLNDPLAQPEWLQADSPDLLTTGTDAIFDSCECVSGGVR